MDKVDMADYSVSESLDFLIKAAQAGDKLKEGVADVEAAYDRLSKALEEHIGNNKWKAICIKAELNTRRNKEYGSYALALQVFILGVATLLVGIDILVEVKLLISIIAIVSSILYLLCYVKHSLFGRGEKRLEIILDEYIEQCTCSQSCSVKLSTCSKKTAHTDCGTSNCIIVDGQGNSASINYN